MITELSGREMYEGQGLIENRLLAGAIIVVSGALIGAFESDGLGSVMVIAGLAIFLFGLGQLTGK